MANQGKPFERDIKASETGVVKVIRLEDGNDKTTPVQPADFIMFDGKVLLYVECKSYQGDSIPMAKLTQIDDMFDEVNGRENTEGYFLLNFRNHDETRYISVGFLKSLRDMGIKAMKLEALQGYINQVFQEPNGPDKWEYDLEMFFKSIKRDKHYK
ncbi:MAG: hypothetical protein GY800_08925 [Planctomycetes bacterium]|nr:hypothetical protein [Planctomycetota bacterium]